MPRDGSGVYTRPPGTDGIPNTTIESTKYNLNVGDVETDLNAARPIIAGGTGANNATAARDNLDAEVAMKQVTNYDSAIWESGSFFSLSSATSPPVAGAGFSGTAWVLDTNNIVLEARNESDSVVPGRQYVREKKAGVWGAWVMLPGSTVGQYVLRAGDTMSGALSVSPTAGNIITMNVSGSSPQITSGVNANSRWLVMLGDGTAESGSNAGSNFGIARYTDLGVYVDVPLAINRATGATTLTASSAPALDVKVNAAGAIATFADNLADSIAYIQINAQAGGAQFGCFSNYPAILKSSLTDYWMQIDTNNNLANVKCNIAMKAPTSSANSTLLIQDDAGADKGYIYWNRSTNVMFIVNTGAGAANPINLGSGLGGKIGQSGAWDGFPINFHWVPSVLSCYVNDVNLGNVSFTSDYRIKKDVVELPSTWAIVKALRPVSYTQAQFTPPVEVIRVAKEAAEREEKLAKGEEVGPPPPFLQFEADDIERWGFIAHELQATMVPSAATGHKDDANLVQSPNPWTIIAALTRTLQEAMARIEALEAAAL